MAVYLHRSLRQPAGILDVLKGKFMPKPQEDQYIWNCCTCFHVMWLQYERTLKLRTYHTQPFMCRVFSICLGPRHEKDQSLDTFFAAREDDILQFAYSEDDQLFICTWRLKLPRLCLSPDFIHYRSNMIFVSCAHGGVCSCPMDGEFIYVDKPVNVVLAVFACGTDSYIRIEEGYAVVKYTTHDQDRIFLDVQGKIIHAFAFDSETVCFCTPNAIVTCAARADFQRQSVIELPPTFQPACILGCLLTTDPRTFMLVGWSDRKPELYRLFEMNGALTLTKGDMSSISKSIDIWKMFYLSNNVYLVVNKAGDHQVRDLNRQIEARFPAFTGSRQLHLLNPTARSKMETRMTVIPRALSFAGHHLGIMVEGIRTKLFGSVFMLDGEPTGLFHFEFRGREYVIVSFARSSKLLRVNSSDDPAGASFSEPSRDDEMRINETVRTVALISVAIREQTWFQVTPIKPERLPYNPPEMPPANPRRVLIAVRSNGKQSISVFAPSSIRIESWSEQKKGDYALDGRICAVDLSPVNSDGLSEYVAFGYQDSRGDPCVLVQDFCTDTAARQDRIKDIMKARISAVKFLDNEVHPWNGKLLIGLENGAIVYGQVDFRIRHITNIQFIQLGVSPVTFVSLEREWLLAVCQKPAILVYQNEKLEHRPLTMTSSAFAVPLRSSGGYVRFISVCGRQIGFYAVEKSNTVRPSTSCLYFDRDGEREDIVGVVPVSPGNSPGVLVATKSDIWIVDVTSFQCSRVPGYDKRGQIMLFAGNVTSGRVVDQPYIVTVGQLVNKTEQVPNRDARRPTVSTVVVSKVRLVERQDFAFLSFEGLDDVCSRQFPGLFSAAAITDCAVQPRSTMPVIVLAVSGEIKLFRIMDRTLELIAYLSPGLSFKSVLTHFEIRRSFQRAVPRLVIFAADSQMLKVVAYNFDKKQFKLKAEEGTIRPVTNMVFADNRLLGGDRLGNMCVLERRRGIGKIQGCVDGRLTNTKTRLHLAMNFHVGDPVTGVAHSRDFFPFLWYSTVSGGLGGFMVLDLDGIDHNELNEEWSRRKHIMRLLELEISNVFLELTKCDSIAFRNKYFPAENVIDLDVVGMFESLGPALRESITRRVQQKLASIKGASDGEKLTAESVEMLITHVCRYFLWNSFSSTT